MTKGIENGVDIINDVSGLNFDKNLLMLSIPIKTIYFTSHARNSFYNAKQSNL